MSKPKDVAGVQRFIGMVKYLAKFLPRLSEVCEPVRNLTHKDAPWVWGKDHDKSFADIQKAICEAPVLKYFDHKAATEGQADASSKGLGFVLIQEGRPVSYASRALTPAVQNYSQIEKELLVHTRRQVIDKSPQLKKKSKLSTCQIIPPSLSHSCRKYSERPNVTALYKH